MKGACGGRAAGRGCIDWVAAGRGPTVTEGVGAAGIAAADTALAAWAF